MRTKLRVQLGSMMVVIMMAFSACEGDQGEIGPKGDPGAQGEQGLEGEQGSQGEKGDSEATSFGNVELTISGVDLDSEEFTEVVDFKYLPYNDASSSYWYVYEDGGSKTFSIRRENKIAAKTNGRAQDSGNTVYLDLSQDDGGLVLNSFSFSSTLIVRNAFIYFDDHVSSMDDDGQNFVITNYSFDDTTGALKFNFTYSYTNYNEEVVEISGKVNVIVYKAMPA